MAIQERRYACTEAVQYVITYVSELRAGLVGAAEPPVNDVDPVRLRVAEVALHEAPEPTQVRRHAWDAFDRAFR